jgi:predicted phage-related endonuclease
VEVHVNALLSNLGLTAEQKVLRKNALGGSDANVVMGGDEKRLLQLWREKRGEAEPEDLSDILAVQMGSFTEPFNVAWFEKNTGLAVETIELPVCDQGPAFMRCTLDGWIADRAAIFEAKHCGTRSTDAEIFARYVPQLTHNCICTGAQAAFLSAFKGNGDWVMFEYEVDPGYAARLIAAEEAFWNCVRTGEPPCAVPSEPTPKPVGVKEVDMSASNSWCSYAADLIETRLQHERHEEAKKSLKELVEADVTKAFGAGVEFRRDKRGALRLYFGSDVE